MQPSSFGEYCKTNVIVLCILVTQHEYARSKLRQDNKFEDVVDVVAGTIPNPLAVSMSHTMLKNPERGDTGEALSSINTIQACALLTLYELKQPYFGRAWMSLGRAIRLGKMMGLEKENGNSGLPAQWFPFNQRKSPPSPSEAEERRRTFWVLYILDALASTFTKGDMDFNEDIHIALPGPGFAIRDFIEADIKMQPPSQIFCCDTMVQVPLSSFAGAIGICRTSLLAEHLTGNSGGDPVSLALRMSMNAVEILLFECALLKIHNEQHPSALTADAVLKCTSATTDIVDSLRMGEQLMGRKSEIFQQLSSFNAWPITTALQVCCRMLLNGCDDQAPYMRVIRIISSSSTTKCLIKDQFIAAGLIE
ncbi:hypothetical protein VTL71DRAFT_15908 [Oculimacula yallundae]|uniref:Xylanolytic transcriptional activator regulatory domain-containing protein n=1 Tax=Oculimacula yallundae TaxID=86028 RepID=A0ABR4CDQ9_9HELO